MADEIDDVGTPEETNPPVVDEHTEGTPPPTQHEYTDVEQRAMAQGWVPEDQYTGHDKWRSAEEFLDRGEFFSKIDQQNRRIKAQEQTVHELKKHLEKVRRTEYQRALDTLRAERKNAFVDGDVDALERAEQRIDTLKEEYQKEVVAAAQVEQNTEPTLPPAVQAWVNRNSWYNTDKAMKIYADQLGTELAGAGMLEPNAILAEVERRVKKEFAHKFTNGNRAKAAAVEGTSGKGSTQRDTFKLTDEETRVMNRFIKAGVLTKEEYINDLKADRRG